MAIDKTGRVTLEIMSSAPWYNKWLFSFLEKELSGDILEIGSGIGNFTQLLASRGTVIASDISSYYIRDLKKILDNKITVGKVDIEKGTYFFGEKKFDVVVCMNVLEHINDDKKALENMFSLLKKDGRLLLLVPAFEFAHGSLDVELGHFRRYENEQAIAKLKVAGFSKVRTRFLNTVGIFGWFVNSRILDRKIISSAQLKVFDWLARPVLLMEKKIEFPFGLSLLAVAKK